MIVGLLLSAVVSQAAYYSAQEAQALFGQANEAYYRGDFATAKDGYLKLLSHGFGGADVLYNLGTACLASDDLGGAVLYLERAKREGSPSADVEANLALAHSKQLDQLVGGQLDEPFVQRLAASTPTKAIAWAFLGFWLFGYGLLFAWRIPAIARKGWLALSGSLSLACAVMLGLMLAIHAYVHETITEGVVVSRTLAAREFPKSTAKPSFEVHAGLKIRLLEESGDFVRIRLPNGLEGWTRREGVVQI